MSGPVSLAGAVARWDKQPAFQRPHKHAAIAKRLEVESEIRRAALSAFYARPRVQKAKAKRPKRRGAQRAPA